MKHFLRSFFFVLCSVLLVSTVFSQSLPVESQPRVWIKSDLINPASNQSVDARSNGYHLQWNNPVIVDTFNYHLALKLDTGITPNTLNLIPQSTDAEYVIYTVYRPYTRQRSGIYNIRFDSTEYSRLTTTSIRSYSNEITYADSTAEKAVINKSVFCWKNRSLDTNMASFSFLGNDSLPYSGKFAELIIMDTMLTRADNEKIHTYLALKYGISLINLNYRSSADTIIWDNEVNKDYSNGIAGLGRDDGLQLYQKQSAANGGESELCMSLGSPAVLNTSNNHYIPNGNFMLWGHDGGELAIDTDTSTTAYHKYMLTRVWKMIPHGDSADIFHPVVAINTSGFAGSEPVYLVQHPDSSRFDTTYSQIYAADSVSGNISYFFNIPWDADHSGYDYFSFKTDQPPTFFMSLIDTSQAGAETDATKLEYHLYPNPSSGDFAISCQATEQVSLTIAIYDLSGRLIEQANPASGNYIYRQFHIDEPGTYFIRLKSKQKDETLKLIVTP